MNEPASRNERIKNRNRVPDLTQGDNPGALMRESLHGKSELHDECQKTV